MRKKKKNPKGDKMSEENTTADELTDEEIAAAAEAEEEEPVDDAPDVSGAEKGEVYVIASRSYHLAGVVKVLKDDVAIINKKEVEKTNKLHGKNAPFLIVNEKEAREHLQVQNKKAREAAKKALGTYENKVMHTKTGA